MKLFTVDFEPWFAPKHLRGFDKLEWDKCQLYLEKPTDALLSLLDEHKVKAIFFILGYVADRSPHLIEKIVSRGHEIATHGYAHKFVSRQTADEFAKDIEFSLLALRKIGIENVKGYRAPSFSVNEKTPWAFDILKDFGIEYTSMIYPTNLNLEYGALNSERGIYSHSNGVMEIPMNSFKFGKMYIPCSGGAYFRFCYYKIFELMAKKSYQQSGHYVFYIHPWELDTEHPVIETDKLTKIRHYYNISSVYSKLNKFISNVRFDNYNELYAKARSRSK